MRRRFALSILAVAFLAILWSCAQEATAPPTEPACSLSVSALSFGTVSLGSTAERTFTLTNTGGGTLRGTVSSTCAEFSLLGTATYALGGGQAASFTVRFSPTSTGARACTLSTGGACGAIPCSGTGQVSGSCQITPGSLDFGALMVGSTNDRTFTLTHNGPGTLAGTVSVSCPAFAVIGSGSYRLTSGQSATVTIRYAPTRGGSDSCTVQTGAPDCPSVECRGVAVPLSSDCRLSSVALAFGTVGLGDRADATFTLTNVGRATLAGTVTASCPDFSIAGQAAYALAPGQNQTFIVRFTPTTAGAESCTVAVGTGCGLVVCRGTGVVGCLFQPVALDFGYVRRGEVRCGTATLTNQTSGVLSGWLTADPDGGHGGYAGMISLDGVKVSNTTDYLPYTLSPGQSRTLAVCWDTRTASAPCDTILGVWRIHATTGSSAACLSAGAAVRGIITRGCACNVTPTALSFGSVVVGDHSAEQHVSVSNESGITGLHGQVRVLSGEFEASAPDYACSPTGCLSCGSIQQPVWVRVRFRPTRLGPQVGKIVVENLAGCLGPGAGTICDTVTLSGTGVTASPPTCGLSTSTIDMGTVYFGSSKDTTLTIRNVGGGLLADSIRFLDNSPPFAVLTRSYALGPGDSISARIRFVSSGATGHVTTYVGNLSTGIVCLAQGLGVQVTAVARDAPLPPACGVSPTVLDFGSVAVGQSRDLTFDLRNTGDGTLCGTISESCPEFSIEVTPAYCLTPPGFKRVTIRFSPTSTGLKQCTVSPGSGCPAVSVRGTGS